ncbi:MAG: 4Fe-4S binding protein [Treponema sp.]|nr:4Fe-4S binding protein [Treponema sp.]
MAKSKKYAAVDKSRCVACGACGNVCPRGAISVFHGCYAKVDIDLCVGCGLCGKTCPAGCIAPVEREASA